MTNKKLIKIESCNSFSLRSNDYISEFAVVGRPCDFYIFINEKDQPTSQSINDINLYHELKKIFKKDKNEFMKRCNQLYNKYKIIK